jgi:hypothetical protein
MFMKAPEIIFRFLFIAGGNTNIKVYVDIYSSKNYLQVLKDLSAIFKPTRRKLGHSPDLARQLLRRGTEDVLYILSVSYRNVSAALSLCK